MKAVILVFLAMVWVGWAQAGEMIKRPLGVNEQGEVIEGYVFQGGSSCNRHYSSSRDPGYGYGYGYPFAYSYGSVYIPANRSRCESAPVVRVQPQRPVIVVPRAAPVIRPVPVTPVRATVIIR